MAITKQTIRFYKFFMILATCLQVVYLLSFAFMLYTIYSGQTTFQNQTKGFATAIGMFAVFVYLKWNFRTYFYQK